MDAGLRRADRSRGNCDSVDEQHRLGSPSQAKVCESGVCGGGGGRGRRRGGRARLFGPAGRDRIRGADLSGSQPVTYENLSGGAGRSVYYRPQRYRAEALFGSARPKVRVGELEGELVDLSVGGLALRLRNGTVRSRGPLPVEVWLHDEIAFSADAEVVRVDRAKGRVAVRFIDAMPQIALLRALAAERKARAAIQQGSAIYDQVPPLYHAAIYDAVRFLSHWQAFLKHTEDEIQRLGGGERQSRVQELESRAEERMRVEWRAVHSRANEAAEAILKRPEFMHSAKRLTELLVTPLLLPAPIWRQAFVKPLGYPGDFQFMNCIYDASRTGDSVYARIMHQLGREEVLAATVLDRCQFLMKQIRHAIQQSVSRGASEVRICSIGAGPARELEEVLLNVGVPARVAVWLVDQDENALGFAYERLQRAARSSGANVQVNCRFISFREMVRDSALMSEMAGQDLIYSAGLFDYLRQEVAQKLVTDLVPLVGPQGRLLIGNAALAEGVRWVPEFVLDWQLRYRTVAEMEDLGSRLPRGLKREVLRDDSGVWLFLSIERA